MRDACTTGRGTCPTSDLFKYIALGCFSSIFSSKLARRRSLPDFVEIRRKPFGCQSTRTGTSIGMIHFTSTSMKKGASRERVVPMSAGSKHTSEMFERAVSAETRRWNSYLQLSDMQLRGLWGELRVHKHHDQCLAHSIAPHSGVQ